MNIIFEGARYQSKPNEGLNRTDCIMTNKSFWGFAACASLAAFLLLTQADLALAHVGVSPVHDLLHGLEHPLTGIDHICAMFAVGLWAAQRGGRAIWVVPLTFVTVMTVGGFLGMSRVPIPFVEPGIILSVVTLGLFVAAAVQLPLSVSASIVALFALVHGYAHGAETPASASGLSFAIGFIAATVALHALGIGFGVVFQRVRQPQLLRAAGAAIAIFGVYLVLA
jgi:urease accessory protein